MWLKYGFLANEEAVIIVNTVGTTLFLAYSLVFWKYASNIRMTYQQFFTALMVLCLTFTYTEWYEVNRAEAIKVVGKFERNHRYCSIVVRNYALQLFQFHRIFMLYSYSSLFCCSLLYARGCVPQEIYRNATNAVDPNVIFGISAMVCIGFACQRSILTSA